MRYNIYSRLSGVLLRTCDALEAAHFPVARCIIVRLVADGFPASRLAVQS